jgi:hypothetical protein
MEGRLARVVAVFVFGAVSVVVSLAGSNARCGETVCDGDAEGCR